MPFLSTLALLALLAGFTQGAVGFGFGMVVMAVLPQLMDVREAVPMVAILCLVVNVVVLWRWRGSLEWRKVLPLLVGGLVGAPVGVLFLTSVDPRFVKGTLGVVLVLYAVGSLLASNRSTSNRNVRDGGTPPRRARVREAWGYLAGLVGGTLGGAFNTGGPPAILYATAGRWAPGAFKANLQGFFLLVTVLQVVLFASAGLITPRLLEMDLVALPALVVGVGIGIRVSRSVDPALFRRIILVLLLVLGSSLLIRSIAA